MAYVSQELKSKLAPKIKSVLKKYNLKGSISVKHHSTLVVTISSGDIDFIDNFNQTGFYDGPVNKAKDYIQVNEYYIDRHFSGKAAEALLALRDAMDEGNFDESDIQSDYFHVGWYTNINIGKWDKPYAVTAA